jgi:hypothetical protein
VSTPPGPRPPPFGTPPPTPPAYGAPYPQAYAPRVANSGRTVDRTLSWILYVLQALGTLVLGVMSIFSVFATDSCGSTASDTVPAVCDSDYFGNVLIGYWIALLVLVVGTLIALIVTTATKRLLWPWALGGALLTLVSTIVFFVLITR